jgi:hypothetical protein
MRMRLFPALSLLMVALLSLMTSSARAATPEEIDRAIKRTVEYFYSKQNAEGTWENSPTGPDRGADRHDISGGQWGGETALITYALLAAGESPNDPRLKKAIDFLRQADDMKGFYAIGMRAQIWNYLPPNKENQEAWRRDFRLLRAGVGQERHGSRRGLYDYLINNDSRVDLSVSQYGVLGMWAMAQVADTIQSDVSSEIREYLTATRGNYWKEVEDAWKKYQDPASGGWAYSGRPTDGHPFAESITTAGVASLFITQDYLHADEGIDCRGNAKNEAIEKGIKFISDRYDGIAGLNVKWPLYTLYGVERIGVASGLKYFNNVDWFARGAETLVRRQNKDGSFPGSDKSVEVSSAFALLFLSRGREPVMMNKLSYTRGEGAKKTEGFWNQRPRDAANIARFTGKQIERFLNWQIINLDVGTVRDFHDAPLLYIAGSTALTFDKDELAKLKQYVEEGGILVFNADCKNRAFSQSVEKIIPPLFGDSEFTQLTNTHPILNNQIFKGTSWGTGGPRVKVLSNGVRVQAVLLDDDLARAWQLRDTGRGAANHQFMVNLFQYAIDKDKLYYKGDSYVVYPDPKITPTRTIKLARLAYGQNSDPEPGGWRRMAAILRNKHKVDLQVATVKLDSPDLLNYKVAHLTGTFKVEFKPAEIENLKKFLAAGGTLLIDSAGGSGDFNISMEVQLPKIIAGVKEGTGELLPDSHPLFTVAGQKMPEIRYRSFASTRIRNNRHNLRGTKLGNRVAIVYSGEDLTAGIVGNQVDGIFGYTPATATELMTRMVLWADTNDGKTSTTQPTTRPATQPAKK